MIQNRRSFLLGQVAHLREIRALADKDEHALFSRGRENRIASLLEEVANLVEAPPEPSVIVTFEGKSVVGAQSIGIGLYTKTMMALQQIIGLVAGTMTHLPATDMGKPRSAAMNDLHFVGNAYGSFGYELATRNSDGLFSEQDTGAAIDRTLSILEAAGQDEEKFYAIIENEPPQLLTKLKDFLAPVKSDKGSARMVTATRELLLDRDQVVLAYERINSTVKKDYTAVLVGVFKGALLSSRVYDFELLDHSIAKSPVDEALDDEKLAGFAERYMDRRVSAVFNVVVIERRGGVEKTVYTLMDIQGLA